MRFCLVLWSLLSLATPSLLAQQVPNVSSSSSSGPEAQQVSAATLPLQAQLNAMQAQAQRQFGQLNGLVMNAVNGSKYSNVLEALSNVGKAIHQQISAATNPNHVNIITAPSSSSVAGESANSKKNEYQSIVVTDQGSSLVPGGQRDQQAFASNQTLVVGGGGGGQPAANDYREQGELLRQDIMRRAGQLQAVVASSMDLLKNNGDLIVRRLLEQMNIRLDQAKAKADRIINEPATNEVALKALATINLGLNNLNTIISNIANRLDQANKENQYRSIGSSSAMVSQQAHSQPNQPANRAQLPSLLDANKFRTNLHQLGQQFQSVLNNSQLHQQLLALRQRQRQQMSLLQLAPNQAHQQVSQQAPQTQQPAISEQLPQQARIKN